MGISKSKLQGLVLPCQSGKTSKAIDLIQERFKHVSELFDGSKTDLNVWISANNKMLVKQTESRMERDLYAVDDDSDDDDADAVINGTVFSWMSGTKHNNIHPDSLVKLILKNKISMIVMCSNGVRIRYLDYVLKELLDYGAIFDKKINIWIDEADVSMNSWSKYPHVLEMPFINQVILVTGTIESIVRKYGSIRVIAYETTYPECYRRLTDAECIEVEYASSDMMEYLAEVIRPNYEWMVQPGMRAFIPGEFKKESHEDISKALLSIGFVVIILNGTHKELRFPEGNVIDLTPYLTIGETNTPEEFNETLAAMYVTNHLDRYPLAITGCLCVERGITFQCAPKNGHNGFLFDYGIIPPIADKAAAYQTMARLFGNIGHFPNYKKCKIFTNHATFKKVHNQEEIAVNLARIMYERGQDEATLATLKDAASFEDEKSLEMTPKEFDTLDELNDFLTSERLPKHTSLNKDPTDERFILSSLTTKPERLSYNDVTENHRNWTKTSGWDKKAVESIVATGKPRTRLFVCYKDTTDPSTIVFVLRVLKRK